MGEDCALRCCGFVQGPEPEHLKGLIIYWDNISLGKARMKDVKIPSREKLGRKAFK